MKKIEPIQRSVSYASSVRTCVRHRTVWPGREKQRLGRSDDIIIAIMGPTGVGKSNFIEKLTGNTGTQSLKISGQGLASQTSEINTIRIYGHPLYGSRIVLVDTPGFDDTHRSDMEILTLISKWLKQRYESGVLLSGLIYLHRITDNRMSGSPARNLRMFGKLCGDAAADRVAFITTMWDRAGSDEKKLDIYERRQEQLKAYWDPMTRFGAQIGKFANSTDSAWEAVSLLLKVTIGSSGSIREGSIHKDFDSQSVVSRASTRTFMSRKLGSIISAMPGPKFQWSSLYKRKEDHSEDLSTLPPIDSVSIELRPPLPHRAHPQKSTIPFPASPITISEPTSPGLGSPGQLWLGVDNWLSAGNRLTVCYTPSLAQPSLPVTNTVQFPRSVDTPDVRRISNISSPSIYSQHSPVETETSATTITPALAPPSVSDHSDSVTVVDAPLAVLHVQSELVDERKKVHETDAAQTLYTALQTIMQENKRTLKILLDEQKEKLDGRSKDRLERDIKKLETQLDKTFEDMKRLQMPRFRRVFLKVCPASFLHKTHAIDMGPAI